MHVSTKTHQTFFNFILVDFIRLRLVADFETSDLISVESHSEDSTTLEWPVLSFLTQRPVSRAIMETLSSTKLIFAQLLADSKTAEKAQDKLAKRFGQFPKIFHQKSDQEIRAKHLK